MARWLLWMAAVVVALVVMQSALAFGPLTDDFPISNIGAGHFAESPSVAYNPNANEYLVTWWGNAAGLAIGEQDIFAQRVSATGALLGDQIRVSDMGPTNNGNYSGGYPSVAFNPVNNEYLVVWQGDDNTGALADNEEEIFAQRLTAAGAPVGADDYRISDMGVDGVVATAGWLPTIAYNSADNTYLVTWQGSDVSQEQWEIYGQRLDAAGAETGTNDFRISSMGPDGDFNYDAYTPNVAYNGFDNEWLVTWRGDDNTAPLVNDEFEVFGQRVDHLGTEVGTDDFRISDMGPNGDTKYGLVGGVYGGGHGGSVAFDPVSTQYLVTWSGNDVRPSPDQEYDVYGQRLDHLGAEVGTNDFRISDMGPDDNSTYRADDPTVTFNSTDKQWLVTWRGDDNTPPLVNDEFEVFGQLIDESGAEIGDNDFRVTHIGPDGSTGAGVSATGSPKIGVAYNKTDDEYLPVWAGSEGGPTDISGLRLGGPPIGGGGPGGGGTPTPPPAGGTPGPSPTATPPASFGSTTGVILGFGSARVAAGGKVKVQISNTNNFAVTGVIYGVTTKKVSTSRKRLVKLASKSFTIPANAKKTVTLKLPRVLKRLLARTGRLSLRMIATVKDPAGHTRRVTKTLKLKKR